MTGEEIRKKYAGRNLIALSDSSNELKLYADMKPLDWPSDWPTESLTPDWIEKQGFKFVKLTRGTHEKLSTGGVVKKVKVKDLDKFAREHEALFVKDDECHKALYVKTWSAPGHSKYVVVHGEKRVEFRKRGDAVRHYNLITGPPLF